jgi:thiol-disulfide isomerase/thioredoxin
MHSFPITALSLLLFFGCNQAFAQEKKVESPNGEPVNVSQWQAVSVPESQDLTVLDAFIATTKKLQPRTPEQYVEMQRAIRTAAKKIIESSKDKSSPLFKKAEADFVNASVMLLGNEGPDAQRKTFERFRDYLKTRSKIEFVDVQMAMLAGQNLEQLADYSLAKEAYISFADVMSEKKDDSLTSIIAMFESNARRLDLPGKELPLISTTITGEDFNLKSQRGKYVLVYFWSSTIKACEQEHPYLLSVYKEYKERGFEVVAISLDEKKELATQFIKKNDMPWINLWDTRKDGVAKIMEGFGVNAIPTLFLLDPEGKVISLEARGLLLGRALARYLPTQAAASSAVEPSTEKK